MNHESRYRYEKRIRELEAKNFKLANDVYQYRTALSEIHDGVVEALPKGHTSLSFPWILTILKRCWREL